MVGFKYSNFSELISQALEVERIKLEVTPVKEKSEKTEKSEKDKGENQLSEVPMSILEKERNLGDLTEEEGLEGVDSLDRDPLDLVSS